MENTHRFSGHQQISDITLLLWKLGNLCIDEMETLLYGTDYKHGYLFRQVTQHTTPEEKESYEIERYALLDLMIDVVQELGITQEEIAASWQRVEQERKEGHAWGKEWVEKYGG